MWIPEAEIEICSALAAVEELLCGCKVFWL
jgi:hypothetical protein